MIKIVFGSLVGIFLLILSQFFIPVVRNLFKGSFLFLLPLAIFFSLGGILIFLTAKKKIESRLKKFLMLTGTSAVGFFVSILLHNFLYGLAEITKYSFRLHSLMETLHVTFFLIAIFICPIGFLVGILGSVVFFCKKISTENIKTDREKNKRGKI